MGDAAGIEFTLEGDFCTRGLFSAVLKHPPCGPYIEISVTNRTVQSRIDVVCVELWRGGDSGDFFKSFRKSRAPELLVHKRYGSVSCQELSPGRPDCYSDCSTRR